MKINNIITLVILLVLTAMTSIIYWQGADMSWLVLAIVGLSVVKFLLVAFQFMELKKAHSAWKVILSGFLLVYVVLICVLLV